MLPPEPLFTHPGSCESEELRIGSPFEALSHDAKPSGTYLQAPYRYLFLLLLPIYLLLTPNSYEPYGANSQ